MNAPAGTTLAGQAEWVFGLGEPKFPSRYGLSALLGSGALLWYALSGGREEGPGYSTTAPLFLWMYVLIESCGPSLYARRGVWWGRAARVRVGGVLPALYRVLLFVVLVGLEPAGFRGDVDATGDLGRRGDLPPRTPRASA